MTKIIGLIDSLNLVGGTKALHEVLYYCSRDLYGYTREEFNARWKPKDAMYTGTLRGYAQPLSDALFDEWKIRRDPSWLYSHPEYKWDSVGVSTFQTSATTTGGVSLLKKHGIEPKIIFDWGAGPGFSSFILAKNYPNATVHYNEINPDLIKMFEWFKEHSKAKNIVHASAPSAEYDLVQAYEIVEHIASTEKQFVGDPLTETLKVLTNTSAVASFLHSSCWSVENRYTTLGHFLWSMIDGKIVQNTRVGSHFRNALEQRGWNVVDKGWNARPYLFKRK